MATEDFGGSDNQEQDSNNSGGSDNQNNNKEQPNLGAIRKAGQMEVLNVLSKATGQTFSNARDAAAFFESLKNSGDTAQSTPANKKQEAPSKSNGEIAELRQMIQSLQSDLAKKDTAVRQSNLQSQITAAMSKNGFDLEYSDLATQEFEKQIAFDEDGSYFVKGKDGNVRLDQNGDPFTLDALASEILKRRPKLAKEEARTGTGTRFGFKAANGPDEQPDASKDPAAWRAWANRQGSASSLKGLQVSVVNTTKN